jgi:hypothetical protein
MPSGAYAIAGLNGAGFYLAVGIDVLFKPFRLVAFCVPCTVGFMLRILPRLFTFDPFRVAVSFVLPPVDPFRVLSSQ